MTFEETAKKALRKNAIKINNLGKMPPLSKDVLEKHINTSYNVGKFFFVIAECVAIGWFFGKYFPDKYGFNKTIIALLTSIFIIMFTRLFNKK